MNITIALLLRVLAIALACLHGDPPLLIVIGLLICVYDGWRGWRARPALLYMMLLATGLVRWTNAVPAFQRHWSWTPFCANSKVAQVSPVPQGWGWNPLRADSIYLKDLSREVESLLHVHPRVFPPPSNHAVDNTMPPVCPSDTPDVGRLFGDRLQDVRNSCASGREACRATLTAVYTDTLAHLKDSSLPNRFKTFSVITRVTDVLWYCCGQCPG